jgi:hypothetical protein
VLNRETRDSLRPFERSYLNSTFAHFGAGLAIVTAIAVAMHRNGVSHRIMRASPWAVGRSPLRSTDLRLMFSLVGVSLVGGIGSMMGVFYTSPENTLGKCKSPWFVWRRSDSRADGCWVAFQGFQALTLSPLLFLNPAILMRAGLYVCGMSRS